MNPFIFGKVVNGQNFTNRQKETDRIIRNIKTKINTILISPRRWGKSSLMINVADKLRNEAGLRFCFIDLFNIRNEEDFYRVFAKTIIKNSSSKAEEWSKCVMGFLAKLKPTVSFGLDPLTDFEINFDLKNKSEDYREILDLPEKIASKKKLTFVILLDEFQNLSYFKDPLLFQKRLRSAWQHHKNVTYCLYGSKRHLLMEIFNNQSMPFYKFGDTLFLEKLLLEDLVSFISERFKSTKKNIGYDMAQKAASLMECHPYYTQQLSFIIWNNTKEKVSEYILNKSIEELIFQNSIFYEKVFDQLSNKQIQFLRALIDNLSGSFSSHEVITKYNLNSSANVSKIIKALEEKEIINRQNKKIEFLDPVFKLWLKKIYT